MENNVTENNVTENNVTENNVAENSIDSRKRQANPNQGVNPGTQPTYTGITASYGAPLRFEEPVPYDWDMNKHQQKFLQVGNESDGLELNRVDRVKNFVAYDGKADHTYVVSQGQDAHFNPYSEHLRALDLGGEGTSLELFALPTMARIKYISLSIGNIPLGAELELGINQFKYPMGKIYVGEVDFVNPDDENASNSQYSPKAHQDIVYDRPSVDEVKSALVIANHGHFVRNVVIYDIDGFKDETNAQTKLGSILSTPLRFYLTYKKQPGDNVSLVGNTLFTISVAYDAFAVPVNVY